MASSPLILFNLAVSWGLTVLIWLVQLIIYPGFLRIPAGDFIDYHRWYVNRISVVVAPLMLVEVVLAAMWIFYDMATGSILCAALILIVWLSTFLLQVPIHERLKSGKDEKRIRRLVATNWIRTGAWSVKALIISLALIGEFV